MNTREAQLQETIWRQEYQLRQGIREMFDSEDQYVHHCQHQAAVREIAEIGKKQKQVERQLISEVRNTQRIMASMASKLNGVLEKFQRERHRLDATVKQAVEILEEPSPADVDDTCTSMGIDRS